MERRNFYDYYFVSLVFDIIKLLDGKKIIGKDFEKQNLNQYKNNILGISTLFFLKIYDMKISIYNIHSTSKKYIYRKNRLFYNK